MTTETITAMKKRAEKGLDPLTGEKIQTIGSISVYDKNGRTKRGVCFDETGREVVLNEKGTWIYKN